MTDQASAALIESLRDPDNFAALLRVHAPNALLGFRKCSEQTIRLLFADGLTMLLPWAGFARGLGERFNMNGVKLGLDYRIFHDGEGMNFAAEEFYNVDEAG